MKEEWKDISGYDGRYEVSNLGRIRSNYFRHGKRENPIILKHHENNDNGYCYIRLYDGEGGSNVLRVHRVVAENFIDNPQNKPQVNHIDSDKTNNRVHNLEWCTCQENMDHAWNNGSYDIHLGSTNNLAKLDESDVINIRNTYQSSSITQKELADQYDVSIPAISSIITRRNWKHI